MNSLSDLDTHMKFLPTRGEITKANGFVKFANCSESIKPVQLHTGRQVERYNPTLMDAVRSYVDGQHRSWDKYLRPLASALLSAINRNTACTLISLC